MDVDHCPFCGGLLHGGYSSLPDRLVLSMRCQYCGHTESYVVASQRFSLLVND